MEPRRAPPEYILEIFADTTTVKDVLKGVLHLIFFHRYFPCIRPTTFDVLDLTLPAINDVEIETLIDSRVTSLVRQHLSSTTTPSATAIATAFTSSSSSFPSSASASASSPPSQYPYTKESSTRSGGGGKIFGGGVRGRIAVEFYEKRRRRSSALWFGGRLAGRAAAAAVGSGGGGGAAGEEEVCWEIWTVDVTIATPRTESERAKVRKAMENMLQKAALKVLSVVNRDKDHIPPITTSDSNPFPYRIVVNPRMDSWGNRMGLY